MKGSLLVENVPIFYFLLATVLRGTRARNYGSHFFPFTEKVTSRSQWLLMGELKVDAALQAMDQTNSFGYKKVNAFNFVH